jgi:hypothetical protein
VWGVILAAASFLSSPVSKFTVRDGLYNIDFPFLGKLLILNYFFSVSSALSEGVFVICVSVSFSSFSPPKCSDAAGGGNLLLTVFSLAK